MTNNEKIGTKFTNNMGKKSAWWQALSDWNSKSTSQSYCIPKKGTSQHKEVMNIMNNEYKKKKTVVPSKVTTVPKKTKKTKKQVDTSNILQSTRSRKKPDLFDASAQK
jgi:thiamine pyrophosphate-dependent acetolactate synthase large subunit-like protein